LGDCIRFIIHGAIRFFIGGFGHCPVTRQEKNVLIGAKKQQIPQCRITQRDVGSNSIVGLLCASLSLLLSRLRLSHKPAPFSI
jgi:hypothetical protein